MKSSKSILNIFVFSLFMQILFCEPQNVVRAAMPGIQCLANGWRLARVPDVTQSGSEISLTSFDSSTWIGAVVPGTALTSYQGAGLIADPYFGTNMATLDNSGFYDTYYWYRDVFDIPSNDSDGIGVKYLERRYGYLQFKQTWDGDESNYRGLWWRCELSGRCFQRIAGDGHGRAPFRSHLYAGGKPRLAAFLEIGAAAGISGGKLHEFTERNMDHKHGGSGARQHHECARFHGH
jgi:hypothetical protein